MSRLERKSKPSGPQKPEKRREQHKRWMIKNKKRRAAYMVEYRKRRKAGVVDAEGNAVPLGGPPTPAKPAGVGSDGAHPRGPDWTLMDELVRQAQEQGWYQKTYDHKTNEKA